MIKNKTFTRGFTLIELLVVIAIIGILASVVLASLNSARDKGSDAAVKGALAQIRAQAELFYDTPARTYTDMCVDGTIAGILSNAAANSVAGATVVTNIATAQTASTVICHSNATAYAVSAPLKGTAGSYVCVDSTGSNRVITTVVGANAVVCPAS